MTFRKLLLWLGTHQPVAIRSSEHCSIYLAIVTFYSSKTNLNDSVLPDTHGNRLGSSISLNNPSACGLASSFPPPAPTSLSSPAHFNLPPFCIMEVFNFLSTQFLFVFVLTWAAPVSSLWVSYLLYTVIQNPYRFTKIHIIT